MTDPSTSDPRTAPGRSADPAGGRQTAMLLLMLAVLSMAVYANALGNGFAFDDVPFLVENERIQSLELLPRVFTERFWDAYRPITLTTFALEWAVGDGSPLIHHATNIALHATVTCLLFLLLVRIGAAPMGAAAGAVLFAVHPVHVEAVSNVVGRSELLVMLFTLVALLVHTSDRSRTHRAVLMSILLALALGSKENGVVLPGLVLLTTVFLAPKVGDAWRAVRRDLPIYACLIGVGLAYAVIRRSVVGTFTVYQGAYGYVLDPVERVLTAISVWPEYVRLLFFPVDLSIDYGPATIMPAESITLEVALGAVVGITSLALVPLLWHRQRWVSLAVMWFALTIFPVSNLVVGVGIWLAERNLYLPSASVSILAAALVTTVLTRRAVEGFGRLRPVAAGLLVLTVLGAWRTWTRTPVWRSSDTALRSLMEDHPENFRAQWHMATLLVSDGANPRALEYIERAVELAPGQGLVLLDYARILGANGQAVAAEELLRANEWLKPWLEWSLYLTIALLDQGRAEEALAVADEGVRLNPSNERMAELLETARVAAASDPAPTAPSDTVPP